MWVTISLCLCAALLTTAASCGPSKPAEPRATQAWTATSAAPSSEPASEPEPVTSAAEPAPKKPADPAFEGTSGVTEKKKPDVSLARVKSVRTGQHEGYDRVVFEFEGASVPGYKVEYVDKPVKDCGSGEPREVAGDARLVVHLLPAAAHTEKGGVTVKDRHRRVEQAALRQIDQICDFEGHVDWVLGVATPAPYRVIELTGPARLVVDVRHKIGHSDDSGG